MRLPWYSAGHREVATREPLDKGLPSPSTLTNATDSMVPAERLSEAVAALSESNQVLLTLRFAHGLSLQEAGRALQCSEERARVQQLRAIRALRDRLAETG